jgi:PAT family beta-lactamase induction signal transducer AmpG
MFDPLSTRRGRLATFFLLYVTEGVPVGFAATAVATQMRRQNVSPAAVGTFVAMLYLPWAWKWLIGPVVDLVYSDRLGHRRAWIVAAQLLMAGTLLAAMPIDFASRLSLFTWVILLHNVFAATQDVAIDALAVATLPEAERGAANGLMFAGAYIGNAVGGSGALFLAAKIPFNQTFIFVAAAILAVTFTVTIWIRERRPTAAPASTPHGTKNPVAPRSRFGRWRGVLAAILVYLRTVSQAMFGSRAALAGLAVALFPAGAYALSLALQSNLAVELGLDDNRIAWLNVASTACAATGCVVGGLLSDRCGRRRTFALFVVLTALPTVAMAAVLQAQHWVMPVDPTAAARPVASPSLIAVFWAATLAYSLIQGLMYGVRAAFFMDLCDPRIGATQFTAYMAVLNLVIAYSAFWQGRSIERFGYPTTLFVDAGLGCIGILFLPWCKGRPRVPATPESEFLPKQAEPNSVVPAT